MKIHFHRKKNGMVLLEVIMALSIFTLVAFSLIIALDTSLGAGRQRNQIEAALTGLENQLALLHAAPLVPMDKDQPDDGSGITYHLTVEPEQMQDQKKQPVMGMLRVTIKASWKADGQPNDRSVSELVYQP